MQRRARREAGWDSNVIQRIFCSISYQVAHSGPIHSKRPRASLYIMYGPFHPTEPDYLHMVVLVA